MRVEDVNEVGDASRRERKPAEIGTVSAAGMLGHASNPTSAMQTGSYIRREEQKNFLSVALSRVESQGVNQHGGVSGARNGEGPDQVEILTELRKTVRERVELARNYRQTICFAVYIALYFWAVYAQTLCTAAFARGRQTLACERNTLTACCADGEQWQVRRGAVPPECIHHSVSARYLSDASNAVADGVGRRRGARWAG
eukprot:3751498-Rhodomonas_salina.2